MFDIILCVNMSCKQEILLYENSKIEILQMKVKGIVHLSMLSHWGGGGGVGGRE